MENTAFDTDDVLTGFLTDYAEDNLESIERRSFEEYLSQNKQEKAYARKVVAGKNALTRLANHLKAATPTMEAS